MYALLTLSWCSLACFLMDSHICFALLGDFRDSGEEMREAVEVAKPVLVVSMEDRVWIDGAYWDIFDVSRAVS